jgi:alpha-tubulin suppressor-like RCC1 family protein
VTAASYVAAGNDVDISLAYAPTTGTNFTIVKNTGLAFIQGTFSNLAHGQSVSLAYSGVTYKFVANYYGGTGNDLILQWANCMTYSWGYNGYSQLGDNSGTNRSVPVAVTTSGVLGHKVVISTATSFTHSLALCSDGTLAAWGWNAYGQLGKSTTSGDSSVPVAVARTGALAGKTVVSVVAAGFSHSLALCSDGTVAAWGYNNYGQLGNNSTANRSSPVAVTTTGVLSSKTVIAIAGGASHSLALCSDGTVTAWGANTDGQLGNNSTVSSSVPVAVTTSGVLNGKTVIAIAGGYSHNLALCSDGTVTAWGSNSLGQLGNNSTISSSVPVAVTTSGVLSGRTVVAVATGAGHSLALCSDGTLAAWGDNYYGQLGNNSTASSNVPELVTTSGVLLGKTVVAIAGGRYHSVALCSDGIIATWGGNLFGQLGNNSTADSHVPVLVSMSTLASGERFTTLAVGSAAGHIMSLTAVPPSDNADLSGLAISSGILSPTFASGTMAYTAILPNAPSTLTVTPTVSDSDPTVTVNGTPVVSGTASIPISFSVGTINIVVTAQNGATRSYSIVLTRQSSTSTLTSLTTNIVGLNPSFSPATTAYTASVSNNTGSIMVTPTVTDATSTIKVNGTTVTSGTASAALPLAVGINVISILVTAQDPAFTTSYTITVTRVSSVATLSAIAMSSGALVPAFSSNTTSYSVSVPNAISFLAIRPTVTHANAAVTVNGVAVASGIFSPHIPIMAGSNVISAVVTAEDGVTTKTYTLTVTRQLDLAASFSSAGTVPVTAGSYSAVDKRVNFSLGFAPPTGTNLTVVKNTGLGFISGRFLNLAQGQVVTMAFDQVAYRFIANYYGGTGNDLVLQWANTKAYAWGSNSLGQLGDGSGSNGSLPVAVTNTEVLIGKTIVAAAVGSSHSVVLCGDGSVVAWGNNTYGQLGDGSNENRTAPVEVNTAAGALNGKTVVGVAAGFNHTLALCSDGTVASWGVNSAGQLGNGTNTSSNQPVAVAGLSGRSVVAVFAGYNHTLARCADGTVFAWGSNAYGQLGNNSTTNSNVPVNITNSGELLGRTVLSLVGASDHSVALCSDGTLLAWGRNNYGQLGIDNTINSSVPVVVDASDVLAGKAVVSIAAGGWHGVATCSDGTMAAFGRNNNGQLGNGLAADSLVPVAVDATGVLFGKIPLSVGGSNAHSLALCADGTLAAWGSNNNGQLGTGNTTSSNTPVVVSTETLAAGEKFSGLAVGSSASHVLAIVAQPPPQNQPFAVWQATFFPDPADQANLAISGEAATPAGDGITNLMKYALGLNPWVCGSTELPTPTRQDGYLTLTYRKSKQATDVTYTVLAADSLTNADWIPATTILSQADEGSHWLITIRDNVPIAAQPRRFMCLKVSR